MQRIKLFEHFDYVMRILTILFIVLISCKSKEIDPKFEGYILSSTKSINLNDELTISLESIVEDSRCPIEVFCIWSGMVHVKVHINGVENDLIWPTNLNDERIKIETDKFKIQINSVLPLASFENRLDFEDYVFELSIIDAD